MNPETHYVHALGSPYPPLAATCNATAAAGVQFSFPCYAAWFLAARAVSDPAFKHQALRRGLRRGFRRYLGVLRLKFPELIANFQENTRFPDVPDVPDFPDDPADSADPDVPAAAAPPHRDRFVFVASEFFQLKSTARCCFCTSRALCCRCAPP